MESIMGRQNPANAGKRERPAEAESGARERGDARPFSILEGEPGGRYIVKEIRSEDPEMDAFLFRLGCYSGESISLISKKRSGCIVAIKDGRYHLDRLLSAAILVEAQ